MLHEIEILLDFKLIIFWFIKYTIVFVGNEAETRSDVRD